MILHSTSRTSKSPFMQRYKGLATVLLFLVLLLCLQYKLFAQTGSALNFDGVNDYVEVPNPYSAFNKELTVEWWVYIAPGVTYTMGSGIGQGTVGIDNMLHNVWLMHFEGSGSNLTFYVNNSGSWRSTSSVAIPVGWHHITGVADAQSVRMYVDGVLTGNRGAGITGTIYNNPNSKIHFGKDVRFNSGRFMRGSIDDVRIWSRALCLGEIQQYASCEVPTSAEGLQGNYHLNQGTGNGSNSGLTTVTDESGNNRHGTIVNMALTGTTSNWITPGAIANGVSCGTFVAPTAEIAAVGSTTVCPGSSVQLNSLTNNAGYSYQWKRNGVNVGTNSSTYNATTSGVYSLVVTQTGCSSTSNTVTVAIQDNTAPIAIAQNVTVQLDANGIGSTTAAAVNNGSSDDCGIATMTLSKTAFNCSNVGTNHVTLTVTDVNGNVSTADAVVTVVDAIAPTVNTINLTVGLDASGRATVSASQVDDGSSDNCEIASYTLSQTDFTCAHVGNNTVTLTVTDVNGNVSTTDAVVTVVDAIAPTVNTINLTVGLDASGRATVSASQVDDGSSDNCEIASYTLSQTDFTCAHVGNNTVTLTVTDVNGNVSTADAVVTVVDAIAPIAIAQNVTVTLVNGEASVTASQINNGSSDVCGIVGLSVTPNTFNCGNIGANPVTLTVTDVNGNVSTADAVVNVVGVVSSSSISATPSGTIIGSATTYADANQMFLGYGNQSMTLTVTASGEGPFTYTWSGSNLSGTGNTTVFTPTAGGNYTLTCTVINSYGCQTTSSVTICVIDVRDPKGNANNPKVIICHLPPGNPNSRQTLSVGVSAVSSHIGQHGGDKLGSCNAVCGMAKDGSIGEIFTEETIAGEVNLIVYPNPSNREFNFKLETPSDEPVNFRLYDISGRLVLEQSGLSPKEMIVLNNITSAGIYLAEVNQGEFHKTVKITKID